MVIFNLTILPVLIYVINANLKIVDLILARLRQNQIRVNHQKFQKIILTKFMIFLKIFLLNFLIYYQIGFLLLKL